MPTIDKGSNKGAERQRPNGEGYAKAQMLRNERAAAGGTRAKPKAGEHQPKSERGTRWTSALEDYDEDKP